MNTSRLKASKRVVTFPFSMLRADINMGSSNAFISRRLGLLLASGALASMTACSPLGWYDDPAPHKRTNAKTHAKARTPEYRKAPGSYDSGAKRTPPAYQPPGPAAAPPEENAVGPDEDRRDRADVEPAPAVSSPTRITVKKPAATKALPAIQIVETGRKGTYYLIDRKRQLCFFHNGGAVARIECSSLPEAADFSKKATPPPAEPAPPAKPQVTKDASPPPPAPAEPAPVEPKKFKGSQKGHAAGSNHDPTGDEAARFTAAYVAIFCDRQSGGDTDPRTTIQSQGLSVERYSEIEGWMAKDERRWRSLTQAALKGC